MTGVQADFSRACRLLQKEGFGAVLARRTSVASEHFQLIYAPAKNEAARLGIVVAKRLVRFAVGRNRIKRQAREAFRQARQCLPPLDLVLRLKKAPASDDRRALRQEIEQLLSRLPSPRKGVS